MIFKKFDIILVNFPFSNLQQIKLRPALVIKNLEGDNIILCQITTKRRGIDKYEIIMNKKDCSGNIKFNSNIYLDMVFTLHKSLIERKLGNIKSNSVKMNIEEKIHRIFCD
ncbi:MAG: type II toxin-antitoxin system PemK/MazF family toxin [Nanoarchaeota archaeon]